MTHVSPCDCISMISQHINNKVLFPSSFILHHISYSLSTCSHALSYQVFQFLFRYNSFDVISHVRNREGISIWIAGRFAGQKEEAARERSSNGANSGSDEACFDCGGRGIIAFVECPRSLSTTGVTCLGAKITRPWCRPFPVPPRSRSAGPLRALPALVAITPSDPPSPSLSVGNPFPQTKGPRGPSTSIFLRCLDCPSSRSCLPLRYVIRM